LNPDSIPSSTVTIDACKKLITKQCRALWQTRWQRSNTGKATFDIIPRVGYKLSFPTDRCSAISYIRLLLDDALLKAHQHRSGLADCRNCDCGFGIEDIDHFLLHCTQYDNMRQVLKEDIMNLWEEREDRGSFNFSVQLLLFPFADDPLTYAESHEILSATFKYIKNCGRQL